MGALPDTYTAYRSVGDEEVARTLRGSAGACRMQRERGLKIPEMFDAAVAGDLKAMYIFGEDVAQTDPNTSARRRGARVARVPRLPGHLRERDDEVRRRDPAGVVVPREARHVHERRAADPARRAGDRAARRRRAPTSTSSRRSRARSATTWASTTPADAMRRDRRADAATSPASRTSGSAARGLQWPVARGRHRLADPLRRATSSCPAARRSSPRCPTSRPADAADEEFPLILVTGRRLQHYNAGTMTRRTAQPRAAATATGSRSTPTTPTRLWIADGDRVSVRSRAWARSRSTARVTDADRARPRLHHVPLPGDRGRTCSIGAVGRRQHVVPGVQGRRGRRAPGRPRRRAMTPALAEAVT